MPSRKSFKGKAIGAVATREALRAAVIRLLARRSLGEISVRDIAAEAGVNHGLVHRHFGSKEALVREAVYDANERIARDHPQFGATRWTVGLLRERPEIARVLARVCLDGPRDLLALAAPPPEALEAYVQPIREGLGRLGIELDPYVVNAAGCAALLGWAVFRPLFRAGWGLPPDADEHFADIATLLDALAERGGPPRAEPTG
jgi:AcrR family transcriptional regulator